MRPKKLAADQSVTSDAWMTKVKLRWIQKAPTPRAARWRITSYLKFMKAVVSEKPLLKPMGESSGDAGATCRRVVRWWVSGLTSARL